MVMLLRRVVVGWWEVVTLDVAPSASGVRVRSGPQRGGGTARGREAGGRWTASSIRNEAVGGRPEGVYGGDTWKDSTEAWSRWCNVWS